MSAALKQFTEYESMAAQAYRFLEKELVTLKLEKLGAASFDGV